MKRRFSIGTALAAIGAVTPLLAVEPELAVSVTDADQDVYVALYRNTAVALSACEGVHEARAVLQLPAGTPVLETTLGRLQNDFGLGTHPRIPCGPGADFNIGWPATTPIWADLTGSGNYYLPAPDGSALFYAVPSGCNGIKTALAIRERLQLPGVLQGLNAPLGLGPRLVLDCGNATETVVDRVATPAVTAPISLHRFDTFLSAESTGDTIYVARYQSAVDGASPAYLPIWRVNGRTSSDITLSGGDLADETEAALKELFGIPGTATLSPLGAEAVAAVLSLVHVDLCLSNCAGYVHRHAAFLNPGMDLGLTELGDVNVSRQLGRLGLEQVVWGYASEREVVLTACGRVTSALGLPKPEAAGWLESIDAALNSTARMGAEFVCQGSTADTCLRRLADGMPLTQALFSPGTDCPGARHLRVELPGNVRMPAPLFLSGDDFHTIELVPNPGIDRSLVIGTPGQLTSAAASCILSSSDALILADRLPRLEMHNVTLRRADGDPGTKVVALQIRNGTLVLDNTELGGDVAGTRPVDHGIMLCLAELYAADSKIDATSLGIQGVSAHVLLSGSASNPSLITQPRYGLLLSADSAVRLHHVRIAARTPLVLRGGQAVATRIELSPGADSSGVSTALMLERRASAAFTTSTASGFRCVASFTDAASAATFILPGNDLARDNTHLACGPGQFSLLE